MSLYEEPNRPANALGQLRNRLAGVNVEELLEENKALKQQIEDLVTFLSIVCSSLTPHCCNLAVFDLEKPK